jgi:hypothetical protein
VSVTECDEIEERVFPGFFLVAFIIVGLYSLSLLPSWPIVQTLIAESVRRPLGSALFYPFTHSITDYKAKALKQDELRKRREEQQVEIRRQKREENIAKRRNFVATSAVDSDEDASSGAWENPVRVISYLSSRPLMYSVARRGND